MSEPTSARVLSVLSWTLCGELGLAKPRITRMRDGKPGKAHGRDLLWCNRKESCIVIPTIMPSTSRRVTFHPYNLSAPGHIASAVFAIVILLAIPGQAQEIK